MGLKLLSAGGIPRDMAFGNGIQDQVDLIDDDRGPIERNVVLQLRTSSALVPLVKPELHGRAHESSSLI